MKGSCLCGAIEYTVKKLSTPIMNCSCKTCQKAHSSAFAVTAGVQADDFEWITGEDKLAHYESSPGKKRYFCSHCGSQLVAIREGAPFHILRVATLDEDPLAVPALRIWTSHKVPWLSDDHEMPSYEEWHPNR
ncbi:GFA family protein [Enterovibrio nigricans]|uniref:Uncharacterized conserved protein n=1 Tax=Enterovibrio nigricans DSM 22720 TaxID=1121868 RepID=A0A1T4VPP4_9GAMM|nr:GFA family protein [Enterovibrio nigricans]PKF49130.1 GFA family protein [Enterovibrio nigricans]SKA66944.1 Uncharacterized conserved protein [Enterovibrio nigricans DSM 22720]